MTKPEGTGYFRAFISWISQTAAAIRTSSLWNWSLGAAPTAENILITKECLGTDIMRNINTYDLHFKTDKVRARALDMHPTIQMIMLEMLDWLNDRGQHATITATVSTYSEDEILGRKSVTHRDGRAYDLRTWDLDQEVVRECKAAFDHAYGNYGAISYVTRVPNLIVWHNAGTGAHLHVQISSKYLIEPTLNRPKV